MMGIRMDLLAIASLVLACAEVVVQAQIDVAGVIGNEVSLPCAIDFPGQNLRVVWQDENSMILSVNEEVRTDNARLSVDHEYPREWNLVISNLRGSDEGLYTCKINSQPVESHEVNLIIHYPPAFLVSPPREMKIDEGQPARFECEATGVPPPKITWHRTTVTSEMEKIHEGNKYIIGNVSKTDGGLYTCNADNGVSPDASKSVKLIVGFAPIISIPHQRISQQAGKNTLLECIITANPTTDIYWVKDGMMLEDSAKYRIYPWDVGENVRNLGAFVYDLSINDFGEYKCVAENDNGRAEGSLYVHEFQTGDVRIHATPEDAIVNTGQSVQMNCTVEGMSHEDALVWWKKSLDGHFERIFVSHPGNIPQMEIPDFNKDKYTIKGHYNLLIGNASFEDAGLYICEVSGIKKNHTANLLVVGSPQCGGNSSVSKGDHTTLTCQLDLAGSAPNWRVDWEHGDRKLSSINYDSDSTLFRQVAFPARLDDDGLYKCFISSQIPAYNGSCSMELNVEVETSTTDPICQTELRNTIEMYLALSIFGGALGLMFLLFSCLLCSVVVHYRRKLVNLRENPTAKKYRNGHVSGDTERVTLTAPNADMLDDEVSV